MKFFAVGIYVAILFAIAFFSMKKTKTLNDFFLVVPVVSAFTRQLSPQHIDMVFNQK